MKIRIVTISTAWNTGIRAANSSKVSKKRMVIFKRIVTTMRISNTRLMVSVSIPIWMISKMRWRREVCALGELLGREVFSALVLELALFCVLLLGFVMWSCP